MENLFVFAQHLFFLPSSRKCLIFVCQPLFPLHKKMVMEKGKEGGRYGGKEGWIWQPRGRL